MVFLLDGCVNFGIPITSLIGFTDFTQEQSTAELIAMSLLNRKLELAVDDTDVFLATKEKILSLCRLCPSSFI